jgi:hypothetical protein
MLSAIPGFRWVDWNWNLHQGGERERERERDIMQHTMYVVYKILPNMYKLISITTNFVLAKARLPN